ncbi:MAG: hypothetical protein M3P30_11825, partial [Chloroflexota bacterium]|nr:hypothetical protein [Chloroflexota bacterium]
MDDAVFVGVGERPAEVFGDGERALDRERAARRAQRSPQVTAGDVLADEERPAVLFADLVASLRCGSLACATEYCRQLLVRRRYRACDERSSYHDGTSPVPLAAIQGVTRLRR